MERALKNALEVLQNSQFDEGYEDRYWAAIDDIQSMLEKGFV